MKRTIVLSFTLLFAVIFNHSFGKYPGRITKADGPDHITTLIINADVTVVLVDDDKAQLEVTGLSSLRDLITFKQSGDTLMISSTGRKNLLTAGTIYVPANKLRNILVNGDADIRSLYTLQIPRLDVIFNSACHFEIASVGELNLIETEKFTVEAERKVRQIPASYFKNKKY